MQQTETTKSTEPNAIVSTEMVDSRLDRMVIDPEIYSLRGPNELSSLRLVFQIPHIDPNNIPLGRSSLVSVALQADNLSVNQMQVFTIYNSAGQRLVLNFIVGNSWWAKKEICRLLWTEAVGQGWAEVPK